MSFIEALEARANKAEPLKALYNSYSGNRASLFSILPRFPRGSAPSWLLESNVTSELGQQLPYLVWGYSLFWQRRWICSFQMSRFGWKWCSCQPELQGSERRPQGTCSGSWTQEERWTLSIGLGACVLKDQTVSSQASKIQSWNNCIVLDVSTLHHISWKYTWPRSVIAQFSYQSPVHHKTPCPYLILNVHG